MQDDQPLKPANILQIVATNQGKRPLTKKIPQAAPLTANQVARLAEQGHIIVDTRSSAAFGAGHIPGAINVQLTTGEFEQRVGWMTPDDAPLILVADSSEAAQEAIYKMAFIALDGRVAGYLKGGLNGWMAVGGALATVAQIDVHGLQHKLATNGWQVLDVRDREEWDEGHINVAHFLPYTQLVPQLTHPARLNSLPLDKTQPLAVVCASGMRSSTAASILQREGFTKLHNVIGGMNAWKAAKLPMVDGAGQLCEIG